MLENDRRGGSAGLRFETALASPHLRLVLFQALVLATTFAAAALAWKLGNFSIIRLLHWWWVSVQGDDSWKPMRAAYEWFAGPHTGTIYHHVLIDQHIKFQYPPASLLVFAVSDRLHVPLSNQVLNFICWLSVAAETLLVGALSLLATRDWPETRLRWLAAGFAAVLTLVFYPVLWAYKEGQIQAWLSLWFVMATVCFYCGWKRTAGVLIGAICIVKLQFAVFLIWALLRRQWSFAAAMGATVAVTLAASLYVFGWANHVDYLSALSFMSRHGESFVRNYSVNGVMHRLLGNGYALAFVPRWYAPYHPPS